MWMKFSALDYSNTSFKTFADITWFRFKKKKWEKVAIKSKRFQFRPWMNIELFEVDIDISQIYFHYVKWNLVHLIIQTINLKLLIFCLPLSLKFQNIFWKKKKLVFMNFVDEVKKQKELTFVIFGLL